jgi:hypothetical protein
MKIKNNHFFKENFIPCKTILRKNIEKNFGINSFLRIHKPIEQSHHRLQVSIVVLID